MSIIYIALSKVINMAVELIACFYISTKSINYTASSREKVFTMLWCLALSFLYVLSPPWMPLLMAWPVYSVASIIFIMVMTKLKPDIVISAFLLSFGISYVLYYAGSSLITLCFMIFASGEHMPGSIVDYNKSIFLLIYSLTAIFQLYMSYLLFRVRRFSRGFPFLFKGYAIIIALVVAGTVLILTTWGKSTITKENAYSAYLYLAGILIIGTGIFIWVKQGIKAAYIRWAKDNNTELYERKLAEKDIEIERLIELCDKLRDANHSINHRLAALERGYVAILEKPQLFPEDMAQKLAISLEDVRRTARDYRESVGQVKREFDLPSTKVKMLDDLFGLFAERCAMHKIDFNLIINGSIPYMLENIIPQNKLETMIGDHLQDAIIAVNASDNAFRSITVTLGLAADCYALTVFDSGIPFTVDILMRLGAEHVTTHSDTGGNGIGFMKSFKTMREYGASLLIDENSSEIEGYTKSVTIRFDGKNKYIISTYRPDAFPINERYEILRVDNSG